MMKGLHLAVLFTIKFSGDFIHRFKNYKQITLIKFVVLCLFKK